MTDGILTQFLTEAEQNMAEGTQNIMKPAWTPASRVRMDRQTQNRHARSLAGTVITRWAQMGLQYCGMESEWKALEKAPTSMSAGIIAQQFQATADDRLNKAKQGRAETARSLLGAAAEAGTLLQTALESEDDTEAKYARAQLARTCATLLTVSCRTIREENDLSGINAGEEARHAVETAVDGSGPEGIPGSRPRK